MREWGRFLRATPCLVLLVVQLGGVLAYPFMADSFVGRTAFSMFGIVVLSVTILALRATPYFSWVSGLVFIPAGVLLVVAAATNNPDLFPWAAAFECALYTYAGLSMLAYMLKDDEVSTDELFAIPTVFTLLAWAFALLFVVVQALDPGAFGRGARVRGDKSRPQEPLPAPPAGLSSGRRPQQRRDVSTVPCGRSPVKESMHRYFRSPA